MILIGQFDSPFTRRVGVALRLYEIPFVHRPWSVWGDAEKLTAETPLCRVPVLIHVEERLVESAAILDALDDLVADDRVLLPRRGPVRRDGLRVCSLATGLADKAVSLFYEPLLRSTPSEKWMARCRMQVEGTLTTLERDRAGRGTDWWLGDAMSHADIAVACALRFTREAHPDLFEPARWPALEAHAARCEALPIFREICQPLTVTA